MSTIDVAGNVVVIVAIAFVTLVAALLLLHLLKFVT